MTDDAQKVLTACITFEAQGWDFKIMKNPNPAAVPVERYVGYCGDTLSITGEKVETIARIMLRKHFNPEAKLTRGKVVALSRRADRAMQVAVKNLRPNS